MRRVSATAAAFLFSCAAAWPQALPFPGPGGAVATTVNFIRAANTAAQSGSSTSDSGTIDATGCNKLIVMVANLGVGGGMSLPAATYAGNAMTQVAGSPFGPSSANSNKIAVFYIDSPTSGSNTFATSWTTAQSRWSSGAICVSNAAAGAPSSIQSTTAGGTLTVTSTTSSLVIAGQVDQDGTDRTLTTGTTDWHVTTSAFSFGAGHIPGTASSARTWTSDGTGITAFAFSVGP